MSSSIDGPAYPCTSDAQDLGLDKREIFAAMALEGLLTSRIDHWGIPKSGQSVHELVAEESVGLADALLAELAKPVEAEVKS